MHDSEQPGRQIYAVSYHVLTWTKITGVKLAPNSTASYSRIACCAVGMMYSTFCANVVSEKGWLSNLKRGGGGGSWFGLATIWVPLTSRCQTGKTQIVIMFWSRLSAPWSLTRQWWRHQMETVSAYLPFVRGIHRSPVNSPHKGQWRGALMFSLICARINDWVNNREAGDLRRHRAHYDVMVMRSLGRPEVRPVVQEVKEGWRVEHDKADVRQGSVSGCTTIHLDLSSCSTMSKWIAR